jgi:hypothetical protein
VERPPAPGWLSGIATLPADCHRPTTPRTKRYHLFVARPEARRVPRASRSKRRSDRRPLSRTLPLQPAYTTGLWCKEISGNRRPRARHRVTPMHPFAARPGEALAAVAADFSFMLNVGLIGYGYWGPTWREISPTPRACVQRHRRRAAVSSRRPPGGIRAWPCAPTPRTCWLAPTSTPS